MDENSVSKKAVIGLLYKLLVEYMPYNKLEQLLRQDMGEVIEGVYLNGFVMDAAKDLFDRHFKGK